MAQVVPGRNAAVAGPHAATERMRGDVQPAGIEVEADFLSDRLTERLLSLNRVFPFEDFPRRLPAAIHDRVDQRDQLAT